MNENRACLGTSRTTVSNSIQAASSCNRQNRIFPSEKASALKEDPRYPDEVPLGIALKSAVLCSTLEPGVPAPARRAWGQSRSDDWLQGVAAQSAGGTGEADQGP